MQQVLHRGAVKATSTLKELFDDLDPDRAGLRLAVKRLNKNTAAAPACLGNTLRHSAAEHAAGTSSHAQSFSSFVNLDGCFQK